MFLSIGLKSGLRALLSICSLIAFLGIPALCQKTVLDSLLLEVEQADLSPAELADNYSKIAAAYQNSSAKKVMEYANKTLALSKENATVTPQVQARALMCLANLKLEAGEQDSAAWFIEKMNILSTETNAPHIKAAAANIRTIQLYRMGKLDLAQKAVEKGINALREASDTLNKTFLGLLNSRSTVFQFQGQNSRALLDMYQMKTIQEDSGYDPQIMMALHQNIGYILVHLEEYDTAEREFLEGLAIAEKNDILNYKMRALSSLVKIAHSQKDSLKIYEYNQQLKQLPTEDGLDPNILIIVEEAHGSFHELMGESKQAIKHFNSIIRLSKKINLSHYIPLTRARLATLYLEQGNTRRATLSLDSIVEYGIENLQVEEKAAYYIAKGELAFQKGEFRRAYYYSNQARLFGDTLNQNRSDRTAERVFLQTQLDRQQSYSKSLEFQSAFDQQSLKRSRQFILLLSIIGLALVTLAVSLFINRKKLKTAIDQLAFTKQELQTSNEQLYDQNEELVQLNHEKDVMLHMVSHDLQSPIGSLQLLNQLMPRFGQLNDKQLEYQSMMQQELDRANELIQNLMLLYLFDKDRQTSHPLSITLPEGLRSTLTKYENIAIRKGINFTVINGQSPIALITDPGYLASIIDNLLSNAIKFSPPGGKVTFELEKTSEGICFAISDNGPGFTEEDQKRMYKRFQKLSARPTANENSTGLGLAITKRMVERLNGDIQLTTRPGAGACFQLAIPNQQAVT